MSIYGFLVNGNIEKYDFDALENAPIGNSTADNARSNAMTVDWDGNVVAAGKMTVGAAPTADMDVATKKYVDDYLSADIKEALLACFRNLVWISNTDAYGNSYYAMLYDALYNTTWAITRSLSHCVANNAISEVKKGAPYSVIITASSGYTLVGADVAVTMGGIDITGTSYSNGTVSIAAVTGAVVIIIDAVAKVLSSISASFVQGSVVFYEGQNLNDVREYLSVTAIYSDGSTYVVSDYTLSGTLTSGTSSVTVEYGGKTDVFYVTVASQPDVYQDAQGYIVLSSVAGSHAVTQTDGYIILAAI